MERLLPEISELTLFNKLLAVIVSSVVAENSVNKPDYIVHVLHQGETLLGGARTAATGERELVTREVTS